MSAKRISATAPHAAPIHDPFFGSTDALTVDGVVCSVVIWLFLTKAVDEMRADAVGGESPGHEIPCAHPRSAGPVPKRHPGPGCAGGGGHHLHSFERFLDT